MITEPGPDKILAEDKDKVTIASIKNRVRISIEKHACKVIAVAGHYDCAGNPATAEEHSRQIKKSLRLIHKWGFNVPVLGLWINHKWQVNEAEI